MITGVRYRTKRISSVYHISVSLSYQISLQIILQSFNEGVIWIEIYNDQYMHSFSVLQTFIKQL